MMTLALYTTQEKRQLLFTDQACLFLQFHSAFWLHKNVFFFNFLFFFCFFFLLMTVSVLSVQLYLTLIEFILKRRKVK